MPWLKIIKALFIVSKWAKISLKDGKVTLKEALDLGFKLAKLLGLPAAFTFYDDIPLSGDAAAQALNLTEDNNP